MASQLKKNEAIKFVVLLGIVSLFADITYEGAKSISGQFLQTLGASGLAVGLVAGLGELFGYGLRFVSGYISDKTGRYWLITFIGYAINLIAVPLLALAGSWQIAASLMIFERIGKAIRTPARDAMLSYAAKETGRGYGFGLHEALDQIGAIIGPLIVSLILYFQGTYEMGFAILLIPALLALAVLACARFLYPRPQELEISHEGVGTNGFSHRYWLYILAVSCVAAGYVDFPLIAFHLEKVGDISKPWIPVLFSIAMAADGLSALILGRLYDKKGVSVLISVTFLSSFFALLVFEDSFYLVLLGMILWGIGLGAQESIMRAIVADLVEIKKRGTGYGTLNMLYGVSWFLGSFMMGYLYDVSILFLILFSMAFQLAAIPIFLAFAKLRP